MIALKNISKKLTDFNLGPINITFNQNKIYCIKGESGSGKSTLLKIINFQIPLTSGSISVENLSLNGQAVIRHRAKTILIEQLSFAEYDDLVLDYLKFPFKFKIHSSKEFPLKKIDQMISKLNLPKNIHQRPFRLLSSGEKQRIQLIRALALTPQTLILDEAFNAIDPKNLSTTWEYLLELNQTENLGIIYTSHNETEEQYAKTTYQITQGQIN